jgi:serine/threonine protein kinase
VHRDVKPSNILIDRTGRARVTDFGIASQRGSPAGMRRAGGVYGTPAYMSPEQLDGAADVNHLSDVFSAGVVMYEMLTGKLPYPGETFKDVIAQQQVRGAANPRSLDTSIRRPVASIVCNAVQPERTRRLPGCLAMARAIERVQRTGIWKIASVVVGASALVAGGATYFVNRTKDSAAIATSITSAIDNYALLCREAPRLELKQRGEGYAKEIGNSSYAEQFAQQIHEIDDNMNHYADTYAKELRALDRFRRAQVGELLGVPESDANRVTFRDQLSADFQQLRAAGAMPPDRAQMLARCPPVR